MDASISSLPECPASQSQLPVDAPATLTPDGSGPTSLESSERSVLDSRLRKALLDYFPTLPPMPSLASWKLRATRWATRSCWALASWERHIKDAASGWWPTPRAGEDKQGPSSTRKRKEAATKLGRRPDWMLSDAVNFSGPDATEIDGPNMRLPAPLNPRWELQLMGFPSDWLDLGDDELTVLSGTRSRRKSSSPSAER